MNVLVGAGPLAGLILRETSLQVVGVADNYKSGVFHGYPICKPADAVAKFGKEVCYIICVVTAGPVIEQMESLGVRWQTATGVIKECDIKFALIDSSALLDFDKIDQVAGLMANDASRAEFREQVKFRTNRYQYRAPTTKMSDMYFDRSIYTPMVERYVDCGAYDGDSLKGLVFESARAFEPDKVTYQRLLSNIPSDVTAINAAVSNHVGMAAFNTTGTMSSRLGEGSPVEVTTLDATLVDYHPTLIKMDIEGAEMDAIEGAMGVIERDNPVMAVCIYHKPSDLWEIPLKLHELQPGNALFIQRYAPDVWETICYSVPRERAVI